MSSSIFSSQRKTLTLLHNSTVVGEAKAHFICEAVKFYSVRKFRQQFNPQHVSLYVRDGVQTPDKNTITMSRKQLYQLSAMVNYCEVAKIIVVRREDIFLAPISGELCVICLERWNCELVSVQLLCGHYLHCGCLIEWLVQSRQCPVCRALVVSR